MAEPDIEKINRRRARRPKIIAAIVIYMLCTTTLALVLGFALLHAQGVSHKTGLANENLLQEHSTLLSKYDAAAAAVDKVAGPFAYDVSLLCVKEDLPCETIPGQPVAP